MCDISSPHREWVEVIRHVRTMPEQKVKSMLVQEVDPRKALLTLDLELIESVTATDQEKNVQYCEVDGAGIIEYSTTCITIITALLALLIGVWE